MNRKSKEEKDRFFHCERKRVFFSIYEATKQAYILTEFRRKEYEPYRCRYCGWYHIGRKEHYAFRRARNLQSLCDRTQ